MTRMVSLRVRLALFGLALIGPARESSAQPKVPDRETAKARFQVLRDSLNSFSFRCDRYNVDRSGLRDRTVGLMRYEMAFGTEGRRAVLETSVQPTGATIFSHDWEDGRATFIQTDFPGHPGEIDTLEIRNLARSPSEFIDLLVGPIWALTPDRKFFADRLDTETTTISPLEGGDGTVFVIEFPGRFGPVRCEIDTRHDWLARRVECPRVPMTFTVTRFAQDNGRWFPVEGTYTKSKGAQQRRTGWEVTDLKVNRVSDEVFRLPDLPEGAKVVDYRKDPAGRPEFRGGQSAWLRRQRKFGAIPAEHPKVTPRKDPSAVAVVASRDPERSYLFPLMVGTSLALIGSGVWLRRRTGR